MISGLLLDFSSTSINTSNTSITDGKKTAHYSLRYKIYVCEIAATVCYLPSTASPLDIFFRYMVMSAALSETEADMLTRGREPVDMSSGKEQKKIIWQNCSL